MKPLFSSESEKEILKFWQKNRIFEKLVKKNRRKSSWSFLDGPITANNPMGVHHAWGRTLKDLFQRFMAMRGREQRFQNGFDCQGLWVEVEVEKELGLKTKKDIEKYGIANFVEKCRKRVKKYSKIQTDQSKRLGQWMDWKDSYYTMSDENNYAIWNFLKKSWEKGLLYKGRDVVPWCLRCGTAISQHEILSEEYQEISHKSVYLKLPIIGRSREFLLIWTTTPWTLLANVAVAVKPEINYLKIKDQNEDKLIIAESRAQAVLGKNWLKKYQLIEKFPGEKLKGLKFQGPFDELPTSQNIDHQIIFWDEVSKDEGTGLVHIAPGCGQEDFQLAKNNKLKVINPIDEAGNYLANFGKYKGKNLQNITDEIISDLKNKGLLFKANDFLHRYPVCWRCKRELVFRLVDEWYLKMDPLRKSLNKLVEEIQWLPEFGQDLELDWLKNMSDWLISKKRYWGLALPIFECPKCRDFEVIGSPEELKKRAIEGWEKFQGHSPHRPWIDEIKISCSKCGTKISRIPDVGNPWLDAGIVPYSTMGYFSNKKFWQKWFPADFICESFPGQFKNWFYSLLTMSCVLENKIPFKTVLGYAKVLDEKGQEMHKSTGNVIWFDDAAEKMGADIMRWLYISANPFINLNFGYKTAFEIKRRLLLLANVINFYQLYAKIDKFNPQKLTITKNVLDIWIFSRLQETKFLVTKDLDKFKADKAATKIEDFILDLSLWYLRRSRKRRNQQFYSTLYQVIIELLKILAPFMPFMTEMIYQELKSPGSPESIHLTDWPKPEKYHPEILKQMKLVRDIVEQGHIIRNQEGVKVRQPLQKILASKGSQIKVPLAWAGDLIKDELNVLEFEWLKTKKPCQKNLKCQQKNGLQVCLDLKITPNLLKKGIVREIIRSFQNLRKKQNLFPNQKVAGFYQTKDGKLIEIINQNQEEIKQQANLSKIIACKSPEFLFENIKINNKSFQFGIQKPKVEG